MSKVTWNEKYTYLNLKIKSSTWLNVLSYILLLLIMVYKKKENCELHMVSVHGFVSQIWV